MAKAVSEMLEVVKQLESLTFKLMQRNKDLQHQFQNTQHKLKELEFKNKSLNKTIHTLTAENESLMNANALLGSNNHKRETKLKINKLIREIDNCLVKLSE